MAREDWRERDDGRWERGDRAADRDDFGQADYSTEYAYDPHRRAGYRTDAEIGVRRHDLGQADYSTDYTYDRDRGMAHRRFSAADPDYARRMEGGDYRRDEGRSWRDRAGGLFGGRHSDDRGDDRSDERRDAGRRRGPSDRVLWAVIVERLEDERRLDLRDVDVIVENGEVTLNGTIRRKEDKRRIEDIADIDGVRHVQNNLRVRDRGGWTFI